MTTLAAAIDDKAKQIIIDAPIAVPYGTRYSLDNEAILVVGGGGTSVLDVWREQNGSKAVAHPAGTLLDPQWYGFARWPVTVPTTSMIAGQGAAAIKFPADQSIRIEGGKVIMPNLPTADPHVVGQLWISKAGQLWTLMVSAG